MQLQQYFKPFQQVGMFIHAYVLLCMYLCTYVIKICYIPQLYKISFKFKREQGLIIDMKYKSKKKPLDHLPPGIGKYYMYAIICHHRQLAVATACEISTKKLIHTLMYTVSSTQLAICIHSQLINNCLKQSYCTVKLSTVKHS